MFGWLRRFTGYERDYWITIFSVGHILFGIICWWIGFQYWQMMLLHIGWELLENSQFAISTWKHISRFLVTHFAVHGLWEFEGDSVGNSFCDTLCSMLGWQVANWLWSSRCSLQRNL